MDTDIDKTAAALEIMLDRRDVHGSHKQVLYYFRFMHLPEHLRGVSSEFTKLAMTLVAREIDDKADGIETTVALRKLLEAKDAAVRASVR